MSLLMDALKRAETSKQEAARALTGSETRAVQDKPLSLEPQMTGRPKGSFIPLPELASHLDAVDADLTHASRPEALLSSTTQRAKPASPSADERLSEQAEREAVRNAFAAKLVATPRSKQGLWLSLGTLGIAALAIAAYIWYQLTSIGQNPMLSTTASLPPTQVAARPVPPLAAIPINSSAIFTPSSPSTVADSPSKRDAPRRPSRLVTEQPAGLVSPLDEPVGVAIRLTRSRPEADAGLLRGQANIQRNELELARHDFEQVRQRDPNNTDALLALAAIARHQGRVGDAEQFNHQALIANPADPAVQAAALSGSAAAADPQPTESRLKILLAAQPESAPLNFALANLFAGQQRWPEAQQRYFNAVAADGDHPDYLFNLAVSLDQMRQSRPAAQHYRLALEAADKRPAAFDRSQVQKRLLELQVAAQTVLPR